MYIGFGKCIENSENVLQDSENVYRIQKMYIGFGKCIQDSENVYRIRKMYREF